MSSAEDEFNARLELDDAIRKYSTVFDEGGTVSAWALVYERSALIDTGHEPLQFAHTYAASAGTSGATVLGLLNIGARLVEQITVGALGGDDA